MNLLTPPLSSWSFPRYPASLGSSLAQPVSFLPTEPASSTSCQLDLQQTQMMLSLFSLLQQLIFPPGSQAPQQAGNFDWLRPSPAEGGGHGGAPGDLSSGQGGVSPMPSLDKPPRPGQGGFSNPLDGDLRVSSEFGPRRSPINGRADNHTGIDLPKPTGTPIRAVKAGVVTVSRDERGGSGKWVEIRHDDGSRTRYAHMSARGVAQGQRVEQGQVIGKVGSTGASTGPHLHFEYENAQGRTVNPRQILNL